MQLGSPRDVLDSVSFGH